MKSSEILTIVASSFIPVLPDKKTLLSLYSTVELADIGDWSAISSSKNDILLLLSFTDIFGSSFSEGMAEKRIKFVFELLKDSTINRTKKIVVCYLNDLDVSPIRMSKASFGYYRFQSAFYDQIKLLEHIEGLYFYDITPNVLRSDSVKVDDRDFYAAHSRFKLEVLLLIYRQCYEILRRTSFARKKVLVIDCDNTIWGKVLGEVGAQNLDLGTDGVGRIYQDVQREIKRFREEGTIICVCSKNEEQDVVAVFGSHPGMILELKDITAFKVNWTEKYLNVRSLASELDLGLDSFVFLDDNPLEREKMRKFCPDVEIVDLSHSIHTWPSTLRHLDFLINLSDTSDDNQKTEQYRAKLEFNEKKIKVVDVDEFIASLNIEIGYRMINCMDIPRASQLCLKTNQFSTTLERLSEKDITILLEQNNIQILMVNVRDIFGDHGDVALVIIESKNDINVLRAFNISCRVLGRNLEYNILEYLIDTYGNGLEILFRRGPRNEIVKTFLDDVSEKFDSTYNSEQIEELEIYKIKQDKLNETK